MEAYEGLQTHLEEGRESLAVVTLVGCSQIQEISRVMRVLVCLAALRVVLLVVSVESA